MSATNTTASSILLLDPESSSENSIYEQILQDILAGRLQANERLKVSALATRYGTSTNPIREALQQLRGEGYVIFSPNKGARVRPIDEDFARDIYEVEALIEPYLTAWFVGIATEEAIRQLEDVQDEIEALGFEDPLRHSELDTRFHQIIYDGHYNRHAAELWWRHREILRTIARRFPYSMVRRKEILVEHRQIIDRIKNQDAAGAAEAVRLHILGSGRHIVEHMRSARNRKL
ncbi:GntR family transcriptional regulator [Devosia aurantiaca]|uniref:GntR family transcriptional regulator n=1 Tax=Devosia aurantiaca TaxID=2714858 RepID=A0A6M1SH07_9HYPH|nr:GntR family transcriptional regulator [Devosia aurantiaca]NGP16488.1 GntR family transcriptional regulator [Devosia aurantiaca]